MANNANNCLVIVLSIISIGNVISSPTNNDCEEFSNSVYEYFSKTWQMDNTTFKHITFQKSASGIAHFEMNLSVRSNVGLQITLTRTQSDLTQHPETFYSINIIPNNIALHRASQIPSLVSGRDVPNILSWDHLTQFYLRIRNDLLEVGIRGQKPLLSYNDGTIKTLQYFTLTSRNIDFAKPSLIYFDCP